MNKLMFVLIKKWIKLKYVALFGDELKLNLYLKLYEMNKPEFLILNSTLLVYNPTQYSKKKKKNTQLNAMWFVHRKK